MVRPQTSSFNWVSTGSLVFAHEGVPFLEDDRRLRIDFFRPAKSVSIDVIGTSDSTATYGRIERLTRMGSHLLCPSNPLSAGQIQRTTLTRAQSDISFAVIYSDNNYLGSSPFGRFDNLTFVQSAGDNYRRRGPLSAESAGRRPYEVQQIVPAAFFRRFQNRPACTTGPSVTRSIGAT